MIFFDSGVRTDICYVILLLRGRHFEKRRKKKDGVVILLRHFFDSIFLIRFHGCGIADQSEAWIIVCMFTKKKKSDFFR